MFKGLEHTALASPNPRALAQWYVDHLEFVINYEYYGNYFVRARDGSMLEIIPSVGERGAQNLKDPGIRHMAVDVDNFDEGLAQLRGKNVNFVTEPFENQGNRIG